MGFDNPSVPWSEMERLLSDRRRPGGPPAGADGGDSPAWSRKRGPYVPPKIERPADDDSLRRAARALVVLVPRRGILARRARRRGGAARPARPRDHRPRRLLRHRALRRGRRDAAAEDRVRRRALARAARSRRTASPTRSARTCSCSPAARRATTGSPAPSRTRSCRGPRRGGPSTTSTSSPRRRTGTARC